jgi:hypothetical protein
MKSEIQKTTEKRREIRQNSGTHTRDYSESVTTDGSVGLAVRGVAADTVLASKRHTLLPSSSRRCQFQNQLPCALGQSLH